MAAAEVHVEVAPELELGDAVGAPAAAEEVEDDGAKGEDVGEADGSLGEGVGELEQGGFCSDGNDFFFDAGGKEGGGGGFGDGEALGLDEGPGVLGDAVELILQRLFCAGGHGPLPSP